MTMTINKHQTYPNGQAKMYVEHTEKVFTDKLDKGKVSVLDRLFKFLNEEL